MKPSYRADQVGSLLRPPELLKARAEHAEGRLGLEALRAAEDKAILDVLAFQRNIGLDVVTDGEYRRSAWLAAVTSAIEGFLPQRVKLQWKGREGDAPDSTQFAAVVGARLRQTGRMTGHEVPFLKQHAAAPFKVTLANPLVFMISSYLPGTSDRFYPTRAEFGMELASMIGSELRALADEGVPYIQLDAPLYTHFADPVLREKMRRNGWDPDRGLEEAIAADSACLKGVSRPGVTLALHLCRGNFRGLWLAEGGYDPIAERLFNAFDVDRFLLEYDSDRAGGFEPLRFVPKGKIVVLGLITTKEPRAELQDEIRRRIDEAAKFVPLENLALSPQCGFATQAPGNPISFDDQRRKLELIVDTARKVWQ